MTDKQKESNYYMQGHSTIRKGLKLTFIVIQCIFIIISLFISVLVLTLFTKLREYLGLSIKPVIVSVFVSCLYLIVPMMGILFIYRKRKTYIYTYEILLIVLMNIDVMS